MLRHLPDGQALVGGGVPVLVEFITTEQTHLAALGLKEAVVNHALHAAVLRFAQRLSNTELANLNSELLEPGNRPACGRVKLPLLLRENLTECLIDEPESRPNRHLESIRLENLGVA